ncbi:hypothetical protein [Tenacibaculum maritimum]|uniref:hypothetical protein n=2 Tax=Tenacibaculum maritimum TaxID=107401 RepID=UPI0012E6CC47|nr:hypothetical protein [Tenacibaculum maritimum]MCD9563793.1 hypothetical protein [Tenacibaculum maritimum]MCD9566829.1 hypothetical protein [Tenacibaculum maritimum]MCD9580155.1 hypothetical protein [Tenacibaculum maritimum]MCD9597678.1 hypothetical protein [Tenacibaculum maritimum]MCD9610659.1 hypothetical protein [Tenacibaculum maritimum]
MKKNLMILSIAVILFSCTKNEENSNLDSNENQFYIEYTVDNRTYSMNDFTFTNSSQDTGFVYKVNGKDSDDNNLDLEISNINIGNHNFNPVEGTSENEVDIEVSFENREWSGKANGGKIKILKSENVFEATFSGIFKSDNMEKNIEGKIRVQK